jgi:hypothetical protein
VFIAWVIGIPFRLLVTAGLIDNDSLRSKGAISAIKNLFVGIGYLLTYGWVILQGADKLGYADVVKKFVHKFI